jgi:hypothetical protein
MINFYSLKSKLNFPVNINCCITLCKVIVMHKLTCKLIICSLRALTSLKLTSSLVEIIAKLVASAPCKLISNWYRLRIYSYNYNRSTCCKFSRSTTHSSLSLYSRSTVYSKLSSSMLILILNIDKPLYFIVYRIYSYNR